MLIIGLLMNIGYQEGGNCMKYWHILIDDVDGLLLVTDIRGTRIYSYKEQSHHIDEDVKFLGDKEDYGNGHKLT